MQVGFLYIVRDFGAFYSAGFATGLGLAYTIISLKEETEAEAGGEGGAPRTLPWKKILAFILIAVGLIGTAYAAVTVVSQWVLVGQGPIVQGERFAIAVNTTFTQFKLYRDYPFEITVKNNDIASHTVHPIFNLTLTSGTGIDFEHFTLSCNGTSAQKESDGDKTVIARVPVNSALDPGDSTKYVCNLKFVDESLVDKEIKVEVALES